MRYLLSILFILTLALPAVAEGFQLPESSDQLVVVVNDHWDAPTGSMYRFERDSTNKDWEMVGSAARINLGRTGFAWGTSPLMSGALKSRSTRKTPKKEGDGRSPAGLFPFLRAFGHPSAPKGYSERNLDFLAVSDEQCVDDSENRYYNQVVSPDKVGGESWDSSEKMKIDVYQLGIVVGHNCPDASPKLGSCIFFHLESAPGSPTSGCTSMERSKLVELVLWLEKAKNPVVLQMPRGMYQKLGSAVPGL